MVYRPGDFVTLRRSLAMAPLSTKTQEALIDECERPTLERQQIAAGLAELPGSVGELRAAVNKLHAIVGWAGRCSGPDERSGFFQAFPCGACYGADGWGQRERFRVKALTRRLTAIRERP
jgi:hypothetical protein